MREAQRLAVAISRIDKLAEYKRREILLAAAELRRLDAIESKWVALSHDDGKAQREIERLRAVNAQLLALLRQARELLIDNRLDVARNESVSYIVLCYDPVIVAINVARGEKA